MQISRMRYLLFALIALATSTEWLLATNIWLSTSDVGSALGEVPFVESDTGHRDQRIHVWARPDPEKTLRSWSLNLRSTNEGVIELTGIEVLNPVLAEPGLAGKPVARYELTGDEDQIVNPNLIQDLTGFSALNVDVQGAGIGPATKPVDPFYDPVNDAWLLASATYDVVGPGQTELFLQIGSNGIVNQNEETGDQYVVFGDAGDPALNAESQKHGGHRNMDSATADAVIVGYGDPVVSPFWHEETKITPDEPFKNFGRSVAMNDDRMIVGARGSVRVLEQADSTWVETASLETSGSALAISGDHIILGNDLFSPSQRSPQTYPGAASIFEYDGSNWNEVAALSPSDAGPYDRFGTAVGVSGDAAIVGASHVAYPYRVEPDLGSAHIFERTDATWTEVSRLAASDGHPGDRFGEAVAIDDGLAVVGASGLGTYGEDAGTAYVFEKSDLEWTEVARLVPSDLAAGDEFGESVALSDGRIVVGADRHGEKGKNSGAAYVFERLESGWTQVAKLTATDGAAGDFFGRAVALSGDRVLVSASGNGAGAAYVFEQSGAAWHEVSKLSVHDAEMGDWVGRAVAVLGDVVAVGAHGDDDSLGSVRTFVPPEELASQFAVPEPGGTALVVCAVLSIGCWQARIRRRRNQFLIWHRSD